MLLIIISSIFLAVAAVLFIISQKFKYFSKQGIPAPKTKFFYGHTKESFWGRKNNVYEIDEVYRNARGKYPFVGFYMCTKPYFLIIDPGLLKKILIEDFSIFRNNDFTGLVDKKKDPVLGMNPFFLMDDYWKEKRSEMTPAMSKNKLKTIYLIGLETMKKFSAHVDQKLTKAYDLRDICSRYTCDTISDGIFNVDAHALTSENPEIFDHCNKVMKGVIGAFSCILPQQMFPTESMVFFKKLMTDAMRHRNAMSYKRDDFLTHLIGMQQKKNLSEDELIALMWTIYMDSFETSSVALSFVLYLLSKDQRVQDKLRDEILANIEESDNQVSFENMMELEYLDQVFHEALRLHPPLVWTTKICSEKYEIEGAKGHKYQMQKGDVALISMHSIHRDPDYYPHPDTFDPDRFDAIHGGVKSFIDRCILLPFGLGGRICAGAKLGHLLVKTAVIEILRNYRVIIDESVPENWEIGVKEFLNVPTCKLLVHFQKL